MTDILTADPHDAIKLAAELESSTEVQQRRDSVARHRQVYAGDWRTQRLAGREYIIDPMPRVVADRAIDKLCAQPFILTATPSLPGTLAPPDEATLNPQQHDAWLEDQQSMARDRADRAEVAVLAMLGQIERQQRASIIRDFAFGAVIDSYVCARLGFDDVAADQPGRLPIYLQVLDPASYMELPGQRASDGPACVIYKRRARRSSILHEGWALGSSESLQSAAPDSEVTIYDCWERRPRKTRMGWEVQIWHAILAEGAGLTRDWLRPPRRMDKPRGLTRIPYIFRAVRASPYPDETYPQSASNGFLEIFCIGDNWEQRNKILSRQAQLVALAVQPVIVTKTHQPIDASASIPDTQISIEPDEDAKILTVGANPEIAQAWSMVESLTQRGTFPAANFGEGERQMSGLMTGRLQQEGEMAMGSTKATLEAALADLAGNLAAMAGAYLRPDQAARYAPAPGLSALPPNLFTGNEAFTVSVPGMTRAEQMQHAANAKQLSEPLRDGRIFLSVEQAREIAGLVQVHAAEEARVEREEHRKLELQSLERDVKRREDAEDAVAQMQLQRSQQLNQAPEAGPNNVPAETPMAGNQPPVAEWQPVQPQAGIPPNGQ